MSRDDQRNLGRQVAAEVYQQMPVLPDNSPETQYIRQLGKKLVATMEDSLRLHAHRPGTLAAMTGYLHERTSGLIGSLSQLIREAAVDAIDTGTEKITKHMLDEIELDHAVQQPQPDHRRAKRARRPRAA